MWNTPTAEQLATIPKLYETEHLPNQRQGYSLPLLYGRLRLVSGRI